jgi:uncharacterized spore protein YtfJ
MMEKMQELFEKFESVTDKANVDAVFGKPEKVGERTLIPVAEVAYGWGIGMCEAMGMCGCGAPNVEMEVEMEAGEEAEPSEAEGAGGGAGAKVRPLAYIEVGPKGTKVEAIIDEQKVALAGILLTAWIMGWVGLLIKTFSKKS